MQLTQEQAYFAMYVFLDKQFSLGGKELGVILGSMSLLPDGQPADPSLASDWQEAVMAATSGQFTLIWHCSRDQRPNSSFKPNPLRGSA